MEYDITEQMQFRNLPHEDVVIAINIWDKIPNFTILKLARPPMEGVL